MLYVTKSNISHLLSCSNCHVNKNICLPLRFLCGSNRAPNGALGRFLRKGNLSIAVTSASGSTLAIKHDTMLLSQPISRMCFPNITCRIFPKLSIQNTRTKKDAFSQASLPYHHSTMSKVPAAINPQPRIDFVVNCSCRITAARIIVITTLSLSTGTTLEASPICRAL